MLDALEKALALRAAPLFAPLAADQLVPIARVCSVRALAAGETLFRAGDVGDAMYVVVRGAVEVVHRGRAIATLGPGECVGEMAAIDLEPRSAAVAAVEDSVLLRLDRNDLMDLLADYPHVVDALAGVLVRRLRHASGAT